MTGYGLADSLKPKGLYVAEATILAGSDYDSLFDKTPFVFLENGNLHFEGGIRGSIPEGAGAERFYSGIIRQMENSLLPSGKVEKLTINIPYFNASSCQGLMDVLKVFDNWAAKYPQEKKPVIEWQFQDYGDFEKREEALEIGEDFERLVTNAKFRIMPAKIEW